jgi:hypothetical protein|tara:strand:+ start:1501 stop:1740 length:240 start_codon:yes stop_codon:yes gene_type:complete
MAKQIEEHNFTKAGPKQKYDWDLWLDGNIWELKQPDDFQGSSQSFRAAAQSHSRRHGFKVRTNVVDNDTVVIQAYGNNK